FATLRPPPTSTLFPYTTLFRSDRQRGIDQHADHRAAKPRRLSLEVAGAAIALSRQAVRHLRPRVTAARTGERSPGTSSADAHAGLRTGPWVPPAAGGLGLFVVGS